MAALIGTVLIGALMTLTWASAHPESIRRLFRRHLDFSAPQVHESHPMPEIALDRG